MRKFYLIKILALPNNGPVSNEEVIVIFEGVIESLEAAIKATPSLIKDKTKKEFENLELEFPSFREQTIQERNIMLDESSKESIEYNFQKYSNIVFNIKDLLEKFINISDGKNKGLLMQKLNDLFVTTNSVFKQYTKKYINDYPIRKLDHLSFNKFEDFDESERTKILDLYMRLYPKPKEKTKLKTPVKISTGF